MRGGTGLLYTGGKEVLTMHEINNEKFGEFVVQLRKEKGMTQKELAEKLYVSDKAVSKWLLLLKYTPGKFMWNVSSQ